MKIQAIRCLIFFISITSSLGSMLAQGDLLIYPRRVVFEGRKSVEKITLANTGNQTATYNISFLEYTMSENGEMKIITEPVEGVSFASKNIRYFPRKVTLGPYESQRVKVQVNNLGNLSDGEYRSHLYFRAVPDQGILGGEESQNDSTLSIQLKAIYGISIPCIIRKGENITSATISDLKFNRYDAGGQSLLFNLNRLGDMSIYGDFVVDYIAPNNKTYEVAHMKGVGVYTPLPNRKMKLKLASSPNVDYSEGKLVVKFTFNESRKELAVAELIL